MFFYVKTLSKDKILVVNCDKLEFDFKYKNLKKLKIKNWKIKKLILKLIKYRHEYH